MFIFYQAVLNSIKTIKKHEKELLEEYKHLLSYYN